MAKKVEFSNSVVEVTNTSQELFDSFNKFIMSNDTKVLGKLIARTQLFEQVKDVPGDIVECGVFKGSGILTWLKLKNILTPNSFKKVIGFDFFNTEQLLSVLSGDDQNKMKALFESRKFSLEDDYVTILSSIIEDAGFDKSCYELIKGDVSITTPQFVADRPGAKISLLYLDLDIAQPTYDTLCALWSRVSVGGMVVFDEYAYHQWSESMGVDRFFDPKGIRIKNLPFRAPTAYVIKE